MLGKVDEKRRRKKTDSSSWKRTYTLFVHPDNIPAVNLYTKLGFKFIECDMMEFKP